MEHVPQRAFDNAEKIPEQKPLFSFEEVNEAREYVKALIEQGVRPLITVPLEYAEKIKIDGIHFVPHADHETGRAYSLIAGTIGTEPFLPENMRRAVFEIDTDGINVEPRFTGKDKSFHGVVTFPQGVPARALSLRGVFKGASEDLRALQ